MSHWSRSTSHFSNSPNQLKRQTSLSLSLTRWAEISKLSSGVNNLRNSRVHLRVCEYTWQWTVNFVNFTSETSNRKRKDKCNSDYVETLPLAVGSSLLCMHRLYAHENTLTLVLILLLRLLLSPVFQCIITINKCDSPRKRWKHPQGKQQSHAIQSISSLWIGDCETQWLFSKFHPKWLLSAMATRMNPLMPCLLLLLHVSIQRSSLSVVDDTLHSISPYV